MSVGLSAAGIVDLWDLSSDDRFGAARLLLQSCRPELPGAGVDELSIGARAAWLLELRRATFGEAIKGLVTCTACGQQLTVSLDSMDVMRRPFSVADEDAGPIIVQAGDIRVEARVPDGRAIAAVAASSDLAAARAALVAHCIVRAWGTGGPLPVDSLGPEVEAKVGEALVAADPQSEVRLGGQCPACAEPWIATFDIEPFLWIEVSTLAVRLLDEVHTLAAGYGWSEDQILGLSSRHRRHYLERLISG